AWERWPLQAVTSDRTVKGVLAALRDRPYGRCVYACDNDVVDHQVVSIEYEGGVTASFTATAFSGYQFRKTRLFGTHGCFEGDGKVLDQLDFRTGRREWVPVAVTLDSSAPSWMPLSPVIRPLTCRIRVKLWLRTTSPGPLNKLGSPARSSTL